MLSTCWCLSVIETYLSSTFWTPPNFFVPGSSFARLNMRLHIIRFVPLLFVPLKLVGNPTILPRCLWLAVEIIQFFECTPPFPVWRRKVLWTLQYFCQLYSRLFFHVFVERGRRYWWCRYCWAPWFRPLFRWWEMAGWLAWVDFYDELDGFVGSKSPSRLIMFRFTLWSCDVGNGRPMVTF